MITIKFAGKRLTGVSRTSSSTAGRRAFASADGIVVMT